MKASNPGELDSFGWTAIDGNTLVVGAPSEASAFGLGEQDQSDDSARYTGAAYVYTRIGTSWTQQAYLKAVSADQYDQFGRAVAISGDTLVIGCDGDDSGTLTLDGDPFDNSRPQSGAAYVFRRDGEDWRREAFLKPPFATEFNRFGSPLDIDGDTIVVAAPGWNEQRGGAFVFRRVGETWFQEGQFFILPRDFRDYFGASIAISGDTIVVGVPYEDSAAVGIDGDPYDNSRTNSGAAHVFTRSNGQWTKQAYIKASNTGFHDDFGRSIDIDGDTLVVGAPGESSASAIINVGEAGNGAPNAGAVYVFQRTGGAWSQEAYLKAPNAEEGEYFGFDVAIEANRVVACAFGESSGAVGVDGNAFDNSVIGAGAAYVFDREGTTWRSSHYLKASNAEAGDAVRSVALSGDSIVLGASGERGGITGINGDQTDNSLPHAGAVYVFAPGPGVPYCPSAINSTGAAAGLRCSGETEGSLVLLSSPVPDTYGQFFLGYTPLAGIPFGDGKLCISGAKLRMPPLEEPHAAPATAIFNLDYEAPYASALSGTVYFQHVFRSGLASGSGFNLSNGLEVTF